MREILGVAAEWARAGTPFAIATLVGVTGSSPRELGASMVVSVDGRVFGNVSGGCVEGAVFTECLDAIASGAASLHTYGISDDEVVSIGLTCGGIVDVLVHPVPPGSAAAHDLLLAAEREREGLPVALALVTRAGPSAGSAGFDGGDAWVGGAGTRDMPLSNVGELVLVLPDDGSGAPASALPARATAEIAALAAGRDAAPLHLDDGGCRVVAADASLSLLVVPFGAAPRLVVVGAVEFSVALARLGTALGFAVTIVDPRDVFASAERFPDAEVVVDWPDRYLARILVDARTAICVLSHDPRFDVPALRVALASAAGYVGAMGSRRTHDDRLHRLAEAGVPAAAIARLRSPIGLDLGGRTPDETALSILAEIVAVRHGATGRPHRELTGPVHAPARVAAVPGRRAEPPARVGEVAREAAVGAVAEVPSASVPPVR